MHPQKDVIGKILKIGIPSGIENGMFQIGKLLVSSLTATFGTAAIAANAVANSIAGLPIFRDCDRACDGDSDRTLHWCREKEQAKWYSRKLLGLAYGGMCLTDITLLILVRPMVGCFSLSVRRLQSRCSFYRHFPSVPCSSGRSVLLFRTFCVQRGCEIYHGSQRVFHVGIPCCKQLFLCRNVENGRAWRVDRNVCGLGVPLTLICNTV